MSKNLVLHKGAVRVTDAELLAAPTPEPTRSHVPIAHAVFVDNVLDALKSYEYGVKSVEHGIGHQGARYFGVIELESDRNDGGLVVGLRNSHDKTFPASMVAGSKVFVCDNLAFSGEVSMKRKHTTNILRDLPYVMGRMMGDMADMFRRQEQRYDAYRTSALSHDRARALLVEMVKRGAIGATHLPAVLGHWEKPPHAEFEEQNLWRLFNAVTEVAKGWSGIQTMKRTQVLHGICDCEADLATSA